MVEIQTDVEELTPAPPELAERANALVKSHPECFWYWRLDAQVTNLGQVRLVVENLREHGGWRAWDEAQELHRCLTAFQAEVLSVIVGNRSEESHFAGGLVLNADERSPRFSHDFDIFHEAGEEVVRASNHDVQTLRQAGFEVETLLGQAAWEIDAVDFRKARVSNAGGSVEIDWAVDSAFRFFPIERDARMGWRLHLFDVATNKALALSARTVTRDYVDIVELGRRFPLAAICWAACGKDPGFSPLSLLDMMRRFARIKPTELDEIRARELDPYVLKQEWTAMSIEAEEKMTRLADDQPDTPIGIAFVDAQGKPGWIGDDPTLRPHAPSIRGCWPVIHGLEP